MKPQAQYIVESRNAAGEPYRKQAAPNATIATKIARHWLASGWASVTITRQA